MQTDILIVSYLKDLQYLELNLRSIEKFCSGFRHVNVLVPKEEERGFHRLTQVFRIKLKTYHRGVPPSHWHLKHQAEKCHADGWCEGADFVLHKDSDCIFREPVTPEDYFVNGKPVMLYEAYSRLPASVPWKAVTEAALKRPVEWELMRRHPQVNPIGVYKALRGYIEKVQNQDFDRFVMSRKPSFPWGFTEHNIIGAFAYYDPEFHEKYHWHNVAISGTPHEKLIQFWSHSPVDKPQDISHGGRYTPAEFAAKLGI